MFKEDRQLEITYETKVGELLDAYPLLEEKIISIAPIFQRLQNPILRKTVAKVTSLKQAAAVGGLDLSFFLNELRKEVGQNAAGDITLKISVEATDKELLKPDFIFDARPELDSGNPPAKKVFNDLKTLTGNQTYMVITPFFPAPMIDIAKQRGFKSKTYQISPEVFETYFQKDV